MITTTDYEREAMSMEADQEPILERLFAMGPNAMRLDNAVRGLADDCGELNGAVKKYVEYQQPLDIPNVIEEVGDVLWRLAQICKAIDSSLEECMEANLRKLRVRYKGTNKCNPTQAAEQNRDRAAERRALTGLEAAEGIIEEDRKRRVVKEARKLDTYEEVVEAVHAGFSQPPEQEEKKGSTFPFAMNTPEGIDIVNSVEEGRSVGRLQCHYCARWFDEEHPARKMKSGKLVCEHGCQDS